MVFLATGLRYLLTNPLGWGLAVVHWIVVVFALLGDRPSDPAGFGVHTTTDLVFYLAFLDSPSLILAKFLIRLFDTTSFVNAPGFTIIVSLITLQWVLTGAGLTKIHREYQVYSLIDAGKGFNFRGISSIMVQISPFSLTDIRSTKRSTW